MAAIPSGSLRIFSRIESDTGTSRNSVGEVTSSWSEFTTAWVSIEKLSGQELIAAQQIKPTSTHKIEMHYQEGIEADMRIKWNPTVSSTNTLHIVDVDNVDFRNHSLVIMAKEQ